MCSEEGEEGGEVGQSRSTSSSTRATKVRVQCGCASLLSALCVEYASHVRQASDRRLWLARVMITASVGRCLLRSAAAIGRLRFRNQLWVSCPCSFCCSGALARAGSFGFSSKLQRFPRFPRFSSIARLMADGRLKSPPDDQSGPCLVPFATGRNDFFGGVGARMIVSVAILRLP